MRGFSPHRTSLILSQLSENWTGIVTIMTHKVCFVVELYLNSAIATLASNPLPCVQFRKGRERRNKRERKRTESEYLDSDNNDL